MRCSEEPRRGGNIETRGCPEERFECCRVELLCLRKKRKDAAAIVVEYDNRGIQIELGSRKDPIQVMEKR